MRNHFLIVLSICLAATAGCRLDDMKPTTSSIAQIPALLMPIDCEPGDNCWMVNYVDHDPGPSSQDYKCGSIANDGHTGVDFAVRSLSDMHLGIAVIAAADGIVKSIRNGMNDIRIEKLPKGSIGRRLCGNGVLIEYGNGLQTQYCHLRLNSIVVLPNQRVIAGQRIALVGMSGAASFPHLHFTVWQNEKVVDPFVGLEASAKCRLGEKPLWSVQTLRKLDYKPLIITSMGLSSRQPNEKEQYIIENQKIPRTARKKDLYVWANIVGTELNDMIHFTILGPKGLIKLQHTFSITEHSRSRFVSMRRRVPATKGWAHGVYRGEVAITRRRNGKVLSEHQTSTITMPP